MDLAIPVFVRIDGHPKSKPWRINMMPTGTGAFYLYLHGSLRSASSCVDYSARSASIGSTRFARNAGTRLANTATPSRTNATLPSTNGLFGDVS